MHANLNRNPPADRNSGNNMTTLIYVDAVGAWMSRKKIFFLPYVVTEICICSHMGTLGGSRDRNMHNIYYVEAFIDCA